MNRTHFLYRDFDTSFNDFIPSSSRRGEFDRRFNDLINHHQSRHSRDTPTSARDTPASARDTATSARDMLFDRSSPNMWSTSRSPFEPHHSFMSDARMSEIPVKVEKSRCSEDFPSMSRGSPFETERMYDERHMNGHHSSCDSLNSKNSTESSSKVHHIPIFIEGRDEPVSPMYRQESSPIYRQESSPIYRQESSPMYRHGTVEEEEPLSRASSDGSSSNGGRQSGLSNGNQSDRGQGQVTRSPSRGSDPESPVFKRGGRSIPITVESQTPFRQVRPGGSQSTSSNSPDTKTTSRTSPATTRGRTSSTGPFVTKVPVRRCSPEDEGEGRAPEGAKVVKRPTALEEIQEINSELSKLKREVETFTEENKDRVHQDKVYQDRVHQDKVYQDRVHQDKVYQDRVHQDKVYRYLEEMLTRLLIRLDNVDCNGDLAVRTARKATVNAVEACASLLEVKGKRHTNCTDVDMKDDTPDTTTGTGDTVVADTEASGQADLDECSGQKAESNEADVAMKEGMEETEEESRPDSQLPESQEQNVLPESQEQNVLPESQEQNMVSESQEQNVLVSHQQPASDMTTIQETSDEPMADPTQPAQAVSS